MDDDGGLNMRNWTYYDQHYHKTANLNLRLFPSMNNRVPKPFLGCENSIMMNHNGSLHPRDCLVSESPMQIEPVKDGWESSRDRFVQQMMSMNSSFGGFHEHAGAHSMQLLQPQQGPESFKDAGVDMGELVVKKEAGEPMKKRQNLATLKPPKAKKAKKVPSVPKENGKSSSQRAKSAKININVVINGVDMDIQGIPIPVCSCTGTPQQCYKWGCGGWQSACCTTTISMYPLPMSAKRRGARIAGRKMSQGAFKKVLGKLACENFNFSNAIDLKSHWAKHGTNKFVTIR